MASHDGARCAFCGDDIFAISEDLVECCGVNFHPSCYERHVERVHV